MPGKQDSYLLNMGERRDSRWVITLVFFLYSNYARHFTRLRHTLKGVTLHCFSLLCVVDIGWMFCRMSHCFGLFFYSGQFKSCFPHQSRNLYGFWIFYCAKRLRKQNLQTSRSFRIDLTRGIIYNWIAYHLRCNRRHVTHHPIDKGGFIP